ncbi:MAG: hypothetical protein WC718_15485 [Phycisphaerales bacterium]|jgi:hypothetical protein
MGAPSTTLGTVTTADAINNIYGIAYGGAIFEANDPNLWGPVVGEIVLAAYLPSAGQWVILAIVTP